MNKKLEWLINHNRCLRCGASLDFIEPAYMGYTLYHRITVCTNGHQVELTYDLENDKLSWDKMGDLNE